MESGKTLSGLRAAEAMAKGLEEETEMKNDTYVVKGVDYDTTGKNPATFSSYVRATGRAAAIQITKIKRGAACRSGFKIASVELLEQDND